MLPRFDRPSSAAPALRYQCGVCGAHAHTAGRECDVCGAERFATIVEIDGAIDGPRRRPPQLVPHRCRRRNPQARLLDRAGPVELTDPRRPPVGR
jgi:hypothetical protein